LHGDYPSSLHRFAQRTVRRFLAVDKRTQELHAAAIDGMLDACDNPSVAVKSPFSMADREVLRESAAYAPIIVQILESCLAFEEEQVRGVCVTCVSRVTCVTCVPRVCTTCVYHVYATFVSRLCVTITLVLRL
jgi:hypothetical protein